MTGSSSPPTGRGSRRVLLLLSLVVAILLAGAVARVAGIAIPGLPHPADPAIATDRPPAAAVPLAASGLPPPPCAGERALQAGDYPAAYAIFSRQATSRPEAAFHLGEMYRDGLGVARNPQLAIRSFAMAAEAGEVPAMTALGLLFGESLEDWASYPEAINWLERAALRGDTTAQGALARMLDDGRGIARDPVAAAGWLAVAERQAAARGQALPPVDARRRAALQQEIDTSGGSAVLAVARDLEARVAATMAQHPKETGVPCVP